MNIIGRKDTKCSQCGMKVEKMYKEREEKELKKLTDDIARTEKENSEYIESLEKVDEVAKAEVSESVENVSSSESSISDSAKKEERSEEQRKRHKHKVKKSKEAPQFTIDKDGSYNIDTSDVTFLEGVENPTQSIKKARGDMPKEEKIKWWEIYKWADRMLARRKIMKEVNKASTKIPQGVSKGGMIALSLLFGWIGAHNFYARNFIKAWLIVAFDVIITIILSVDVLEQYVGISIAGGLGFAVAFMWLVDIVAILFDKYRYKISKEEFISNLNVSTRAKIGKKYIDLDKKVFKDKEQARVDKINSRKNKKLEKHQAKMEKYKEKLHNKENDGN